MAEDKRTKMGTGPLGQTASKPVVATSTPAPISTPVPVSTPAPGDPGTHATSYLPPTDDPLIGATLAGRYVIAKKLGEGGMGAVYLATHNLLDKQVALKVLHTEFARKADLVDRFIQEAKAASRIRQENVIDISDFGTTPEGVVFFAMELLNGHDLHEEVSRARLAGQLLPWSRSKKIFLQICAALTAAHGHGIIHRDLKPENVYLIEFLGEPDFVKLLDFGIAKLTETTDNERKLTRTGMLFGTPEYMSPEQARGDTVDARVDVYAMGCILFQLVAGRVPFEADNFMGVLSMHLTEPPPAIPPEVFDRIGVSRELAPVIERALAKDREKRYQSIEELAAAVRAASGDRGSVTAAVRAKSVDAPATTTTARARTQWTGNLQVPEGDEPLPKRASRAPLMIVAAVVVAGGGIGAFMLTRGAKSANEPARPSGSEVASGSGPIAVVAPADAALAPPPPLPDHVTLEVSSEPAGADIRDVTHNVALGKTPMPLHVPRSNTLVTYSIHLHGYGDAIFDFTPDHDDKYGTKLVRGTTVKHAIVPGAGSATKPDLGTGSAVTRPDTGPGSAVTKPETGSAKVPETGSAGSAKVPENDDCGDPPCVKTNIPGLRGSGG